MGGTVAVTVDETPFVVLAEDYRIVEVGPAAQAGFGPLLGQNVLDSFPGSRPLFLPYYEQARRTGEIVEFTQFYDGYVSRITAVPNGSKLAVFWELLGMLDVLTLDGLRDSLEAIIRTLAGAENTLLKDRVRNSLRVVGDAG
jgi:hypothetical protein